MLLSRQRRYKCIQIRRSLGQPHISSMSSQLCEMWRAVVLEVTGDLSGWQAAEMTYFMTPTLDFSLPLSPPSLPALTAVLSGFLISCVFSTCMPHYILKVNPTNAEITLEDKLPRGLSFWPDCPLHWVSGFHFPSTVSTSGSSRSSFTHSDKANGLFSIKDIGLKQKDKWRNCEMCRFI